MFCPQLHKIKSNLTEWGHASLVLPWIHHCIMLIGGDQGGPGMCTPLSIEFFFMQFLGNKSQNNRSAPREIPDPPWCYYASCYWNMFNRWFLFPDVRPHPGAGARGVLDLRERDVRRLSAAAHRHDQRARWDQHQVRHVPHRLRGE